MKTALVPRKFRSVREKSSHSRNKSSEPGTKSRPGLTTEAVLSIFRPAAEKQAQKEKEEEEKESTKIRDILSRLAEHNYHDVPDEQVRYALQSKFAAGDVEKAVEMLQLQQKAFAGIIQPYNPNIQMLGAENRSNVTCYLDALLFAMFAKLTAFECMLKNDSINEADRKLAALLRLWVNMLRSGKLIHTDITQHIQESLAECGWPDAKALEQQDTSEAFGFITETLQLPLLALQVDLFHQGKGDKDDHKVVHERLLNLAVPPDPEGKGIKLEDCLEEYFNNKVDVLRDSLEEKKGMEKLTTTLKRTIRLVPAEEDAESSDHAAGSSLQRRWTTQTSIVHSPVAMERPPSSATHPDERPVPRHRSTSIIQRIVVDDKGRATEVPTEDTTSLLQMAKRTGSTVMKAVTIPAWQFFRLIPWHTTTSNIEPKNDDEVARHFNTRPVLGICLKRYTMTEQGAPKRQNTLIDIPDSLRLPHFMVVDDVRGEQESSGLSQEYKLVLQSVVCHRGDSVHSGHYISFARVAPKLLTDNRRHDHDPPPDYEEAQWVKFDDLAAENRVSYVDDIKIALKEEMPYLLFYQIVPMVDMTSASTEGSVTEPPSYDECNSNVADARTPLMEPTLDVPANGAISRSISGYFDSATTLVHSTGPSIRFSAELDRPQRLSLDEDPHAPYVKSNSSRRGSVTFSESTGVTPAITPNEAPSPAVTPLDENTGARLARAAARFTKSGSKSRPTSQAGEGRISITMSRLGLVRPSKEPLRENAASAEADGSEEQAAITEEDESGKEKDNAHHHHGLWKEKGKSKKDKGNKATGSVPDRECAVM